MSVFASPAAVHRRARAALTAACVLLAGACFSSIASPAAHSTNAASTSASAFPTVGRSASTLPDLPYAALDPAEQLDLYLPAAAAHPAPLLIWIHGGGWRTGDKSQITGFAGPFPRPAGGPDEGGSGGDADGAAGRGPRGPGVHAHPVGADARVPRPRLPHVTRPAAAAAGQPPQARGERLHDFRALLRRGPRDDLVR